MPNLTINGQSYFADAPPDTPLLWVIREDLRLTGTKYGCGIGMCGSCTVHVDGQAVRSCSVSVGSVGQAHHHYRRPRLKQRASSATSLDRVSSAAMWLLPIRPDHAGRSPTWKEFSSNGTANRRRHDRQHVSMCYVFPDRKRCEARGRNHE
jgi:hypothetical protein